MNLKSILDRIDYSGPTTPTLETLRGLQQAFLLRVPFENLDIHTGTVISLHPEDIYRKIVDGRRGGFCYECNGLFRELLILLGYSVDRLSARMISDGQPGPEFDHMVLRVRLDRDYLVDVGNGQSVRVPMDLQSVHPTPVDVEGIRYRLGPHELGKALYSQKKGEESWQVRFSFTVIPRRLAEYQPMCSFHQTSPDSVFPRRPVATRATRKGRIRLVARELSTLIDGQISRSTLNTETEFRRVLIRHFGIDLKDTPVITGDW